MKILMIAPEPIMAPRGTPISVVQRLQAMSSLGHQVDLLTYPLGDEFTLAGVEVHRSQRVPGISEVKPGPSWRKAVLDIFLFGKALLMLAAKRYDAIHSHEEAAFFAAITFRIFKVRHIYDMHSSLPNQLLNFTYGRIKPLVSLFKHLERFALRSADVVIAIDSSLAEYVRTVSPDTPVVMIENLPVQGLSNSVPRASNAGALRDRLGIDGKLPIVYTGNFAGYQGLDLLIDAAELVRRVNPNVVFVMVGGIPHRIAYWKELVRSRGLEDEFRFVGTVAVDEIPAYLDLAAILVSPRTAGTNVPLKIYTYMLSGKPIVATRVPSHSQVLNDSNSMLTAPNQEEFAEAILRLTGEPELGVRIGKRAAEAVLSRNNLTGYTSRVREALSAANGAGPHAKVTAGRPERVEP